MRNYLKTIQEEVFNIASTDERGKKTNKDVNIETVFNLPSIKGVTATFIRSNKGNIPVYGGKIEDVPIGHIKSDLPKVKYFENCLAWNREGSVGYVFWHKHKFTTNDHHRPMTVKEEYIDCIDLEYMKHTIQEVLLNQGFAWSKTASKEKVAKIKIPIPVNKKGEFDLKTQKQIAEKHRKIEEIKAIINKELDKIKNTNIDIE